jgi:drug/metabolite transporter (DMT)-like permease
MPKNWKPYAALASLCIIWGTTYLAIKVGIKHFPPFLFSGIRFIVSGLVILLWYLFTKKLQWPAKKEFLPLIISGLFIFMGGNLFLVIAEQQVPSGLAAMANTAFPIWILIITKIWNPKDKTPFISVVGILIGFIGQWLIFYEQLPLIGNTAYITGVIILIFGVINSAIGSVSLKKNTLTISPILAGGIQMFIAGCLMTIIGLFSGEVHYLNDNLEGWLSMLYLTVVGSIIGYSFFVYALHHLPAAQVSVYAYVNPIVAVFLGWLFLDEVISTQAILAMTITLCGVYLVNYGMKKRRDGVLKTQS